MIHCIVIIESEEVLYYENFDLSQIETPVKVEVLHDLLNQSGYDVVGTEYLVKGFRDGFELEYQGDTKVKMKAPNLRLRVGSKLELWNKMMKEVKDKRFAGPFEEVPFEYFIQSPVGLVPKDNGTKTRLIFHLSYPRQGNKSVNAGIPHDKCTVMYPNFDQVVLMCIKAGKGCSMAKSDMSRAFRNVPLKKKSMVSVSDESRTP